MKRVYLDWGVVSNLKRDEYAELRNLLLSNKGRLFFVYSPAHFEDLMRSKGEPQFDDDINMLSNLVEDHLLDIDKGVVWPYRVDPKEFCRNFVDNSSYLLQDVDSFLSAIEVASIPGDNFVNQIKANLDMPFPIPSQFRADEVFMRTFPNLPESPTFRDVMESIRQFMYDMMINGGSYKNYRKSIHETGFKLEQNAGNWHDGEAVDKITSFLKSQRIDMPFNDYVMKSFHGKKFSANEFFT